MSTVEIINSFGIWKLFEMKRVLDVPINAVPSHFRMNLCKPSAFFREILIRIPGCARTVQASCGLNRGRCSRGDSWSCWFAETLAYSTGKSWKSWQISNDWWGSSQNNILISKLQWIIRDSNHCIVEIMAVSLWGAFFFVGWWWATI